MTEELLNGYSIPIFNGDYFIDYESTKINKMIKRKIKYYDHYCGFYIK